MVLSEVEREITKTVVHRFLNLKESSPRKLLARQHRFSQGFYRFTDSGIFKIATINAPTTEEVYLPRALAFYYCGDPHPLQLARASVNTVARALQNLFDVEPDRTQFTPKDLEEQANKIFEPRPESETLWLGLYLAPDVRLLSGYGPTGSILPESFQIAESIVEIRDCEKVWDRFIEDCTRNYGDESGDAAATKVDFAVNYELTQATNLGWPLIHTEVAKIAKTRFDSGHFADAAESAFKLINERLKEIVRHRIGREYDGVALMQKAFSKDNPVLLLGNLSTVIGEDMQVGYQQIFSGAMRGIRNPKAHANVQIDATRAMHFIFLASLLMSKIDDALAFDISAVK